MPKKSSLSPSVKAQLTNSARTAFKGNENKPKRFIEALKKQLPSGVEFQKQDRGVVLMIYPAQLKDEYKDSLTAEALEESGFRWQGSRFGGHWCLHIQRHDFIEFLGCAIEGKHGRDFLAGRKMGFWQALRDQLDQKSKSRRLQKAA